MNFNSAILFPIPLFSPKFMKKKRNKNEFFNYFCRMLLKFEGKKFGNSYV